jgi:hypothetical protein
MINDHNSKVKLSKIQIEPMMLLSVHSGETSYHNHDFTPATEIIRWQVNPDDSNVEPQD